jgi:glyceraldehyde 3-phosphate dehydrogenase
MSLKFAINGLGRIGRMVARGFWERKPSSLSLVAINDPAPLDRLVHLLKYDSIHGRYEGISQQAGSLEAFGQKIPVLQERNPSAISWSDYGVDVVLECSGHFTYREAAAQHLSGSVQRVIISAPAKDVDHTIVYGVNHTSLREDHRIISNASCTTNCLAPLAMVLDQHFGIDQGHMTTIHAYTADQRLVDSDHSDLRRARAAALSMIPTSTGAAKAVGLVLPHLQGRLDGTAIRVPTANVSVVDLTFTSRKPMTAQAIVQACQEAAASNLKDILCVSEEPLVSIDFSHTPYSCVVDALETHVLGDRFARVLAWYDNEWGFAQRLLDVLAYQEKCCKSKEK